MKPVPSQPALVVFCFFEVGLGISRTNADSQWNPVYNAFHRYVCCGTKRFVGSPVNVIMTRQTCGQRSSRAAESRAVESTRRALGNYVSKRILPYVPNVKM